LRHGTLIGPAEAIYYDEGQRARDILKEIGVTVEPDRLHDARAKIAKARFSPERLVGESEAFGNDCPGGRCEM